MTEENGKYELLVQKLAQKISEKEYQLTVYEVELESSQEFVDTLNSALEVANSEIDKLKKALLVADKKIKELEHKPMVDPENKE